MKQFRCIRRLLLNPGSAFSYHNEIGNILNFDGKYKEAIEEYTQSISLSPNDAGAYNGRGAALTGLNKNDEAIEKFQTAINIDPANAFAYCNLGIAFNKKGKYEEAIGKFTPVDEFWHVMPIPHRRRLIGLDTDLILDTYDIEDKATLRSFLAIEANTQMLVGNPAGALKTIDQVRDLEEKPDAKLTSGLLEQHAPLSNPWGSQSFPSKDYRAGVGFGVKLMCSSVPVATASRANVSVVGRVRPLSSRAMVDCLVSIRTANSSCVSPASTRASSTPAPRRIPGPARHRPWRISGPSSIPCGVLSMWS